MEVCIHNQSLHGGGLSFYDTIVVLLSSHLRLQQNRHVGADEYNAKLRKYDPFFSNQDSIYKIKEIERNYH